MFGQNEKKAEAEIGCFLYCLNESLTYFNQDDFTGAAVYLENAARSLKELEKMKEEKPHGQVRLIGHIVDGRNAFRSRL